MLRTVYPKLEPGCVCPVCLINLRKAAGGTMRVRDISDYLAEAAG